MHPIEHLQTRLFPTAARIGGTDAARAARGARAARDHRASACEERWGQLENTFSEPHPPRDMIEEEQRWIEMARRLAGALGAFVAHGLTDVARLTHESNGGDRLERTPHSTQGVGRRGTPHFDEH